MESIDTRLQEMDLELMDLERRIGRVDSLLRHAYLDTLASLRQRHQALLLDAETLPSETLTAFEARRFDFAEKLTALGSDLRAATNETLRLSSSLWEVSEAPPS